MSAKFQIASLFLIVTGCSVVMESAEDRHGPSCTPTSCAAEGASCGTISDGCGHTLTCGSCAAPDTCGGGGEPNVCGYVPPAPSGPVAYWKLDDGSGTSAADSSGHSAVATLTGGAGWLPAASCEIGQCLGFDGVAASAYADLPLASTQTVTVAFWMSWNAFSNDDRLALELGDAPAGFNSLTTGFMIDPSSSQGSGGMFEAGLKGDAGYNQVVFARPSAGTFHHYAFVFDKSAPAASEVTPYVDGVPVAYTKPTSADNTNSFGNDRMFLMSRMTSSLFGAGRLDDVRVYTRALAASEVATLAGSGSGGGSTGGGTPSKWITGFYSTYWAWEVGGQSPSQIPWNNYTHVVHSQLDVQPDGSLTPEFSEAEEQAVVAAKPAGKKLLIQVPDNYANSTAFPDAASPATIATFAANIAAYVNDRGYDGVDFDWEQNVNVAQYEQLITLVRAALPGKLITMDVNELEEASVAGAMAASIDQANLMCYDEFNSGTDLWYNAAIYGNTTPLENSCSLALGRVTGSIINWNGTYTRPGIPLAKLGVGVPFYGRRFTGGCTQVHQNGCTMTGAFSYKDLVTDPSRWQPQYELYDTTFKSNYLVIPSLGELDSFNGPQYMSDVVAWGKSLGVGGFMTYGIGDEYIAGRTGAAAYPLSTALYSAVVAQ